MGSGNSRITPLSSPQNDKPAQHAVDVDDSTLLLYQLLDPENGASYMWKSERVQEVASRRGVNLRYRDKQGKTFLHLLAMSGDVRGIRYFVDEGVLDINVQDNYSITPLHDAVAFGRAKAIPVLLKKGADMYARNNLGETVVHTAARSDQPLIIVQLLLLIRAEQCQPPWSLKSLQKSSPCPCESKLPYSQCHFEFSFSRRSNPRKRFLESSRVRSELLTAGELFDVPVNRHEVPSAAMLTGDQRVFRDMRTPDGYTALHVAAMLDRDSATKTLLDLGSDPGLRDFHGNNAIIPMVVNMPTVAAEALDSFALINRPARVQQFYLSLLEPEPRCIWTKSQSGEVVTTKTVTAGLAGNLDRVGVFRLLDQDGENVSLPSQRNFLMELVQNKRLGLAGKDAVLALLNAKWNFIVRRVFYFQLLLYCVYLGLWTSYMLTANHDDFSTLDTSKYRIVFLVLGLVLLFYFIFVEARELFKKARFAWNMKQDTIERLRSEIVKVNPYSSDYDYLSQQLEDIGDVSPFTEYFSDYWNLVDWLSYLLFLAAFALQMHTLSTGTTSSRRSSAAARLYCFGLIISWLKLLKYTRAILLFGPFAVMLGNMLGDVFKFLALYIDLLIPFSATYYIVFGAAVEGYETFGASAISLFRMSVVDYDYEALEAHDSTMTPVLVVIWLFVSGILFINLFIAMLSNTFQVVSDNARNVAIMERAETILSIEENMSDSQLQRFREMIYATCNPMNRDYDDPDDVDDSLRSLRTEIMEEVSGHSELLSKLDQRFSLLQHHVDQTQHQLNQMADGLKAVTKSLSELSGQQKEQLRMQRQVTARMAKRAKSKRAQTSVSDASAVEDGYEESDHQSASVVVSRTESPTIHGYGGLPPRRHSADLSQDPYLLEVVARDPTMMSVFLPSPGATMPRQQPRSASRPTSTTPRSPRMPSKPEVLPRVRQTPSPSGPRSTRA
eukprot:m.45886 g.45886  ORF g.45886 m.45886 type:complete len:953 (+) comp10903_c0_seq3:979-3837(+)